MLKNKTISSLLLIFILSTASMSSGMEAGAIKPTLVGKNQYSIPIPSLPAPDPIQVRNRIPCSPITPQLLQNHPISRRMFIKSVEKERLDKAVKSRFEESLKFYGELTVPLHDNDYWYEENLIETIGKDVNSKIRDINYFARCINNSNLEEREKKSLYDSYIQEKAKLEIELLEQIFGDKFNFYMFTGDVLEIIFGVVEANFNNNVVTRRFLLDEICISTMWNIRVSNFEYCKSFRTKIPPIYTGRRYENFYFDEDPEEFAPVVSYLYDCEAAKIEMRTFNRTEALDVLLTYVIDFHRTTHIIGKLMSKAQHIFKDDKKFKDVFDLYKYWKNNSHTVEDYRQGLQEILGYLKNNCGLVVGRDF